ncbi:MAG: YezD family protein [Limisphaerales bacterium]
MGETQKKLSGGKSDDLKWLELVIQQVGSLRYGVVEIVVHDSRVIQIEKTERLRLDKAPAENRAEQK